MTKQDQKKVEELVKTLDKHNENYRRGMPTISDVRYDELVEQLRELAPDHPFITRVEPENFSEKVEVRHPRPMLSTEKAYTVEEVERFVARVEKEARALGLSGVEYRVTPKLDGLAARDDGKVFATRGNGEVGYEISSAFAKGVIAIGGRGQGVGEIVCSRDYFDEHLADKFEHPRNMVVGIITSDNVNEASKQALQDEAVRFVPYSTLPKKVVSGEELVRDVWDITEELWAAVDYPLDGMVAEVTDADLQDALGATAHHYRWQIAIKKKGESAVTEVEGIRWQVGRMGAVTPVMEVRPVSVSGATIRNVTAHNAGMLRDHSIGIGAMIRIIRSGEVIPKLEEVLKPAEKVELLSNCPSCNAELFWQNDFLKCPDFNCPARVEQRLEYWFKTLGNADWFGKKTIAKLVAAGRNTLESVYTMGEDDFKKLGFGPIQSSNLAEAIYISRTKETDDWRFMAAFGIPDLGKADSRKLLGHFKLEDIVNVKQEDLLEIHGFGEITSRSVTAGIAAVKETILHMLDFNFNLRRTPLIKDTKEMDNPIAGKGIVFTGKMVQGTREDMQAAARRMGAKVQTSVSGKTDFLVCGSNVGAKKVEKAEAKGVTVVKEDWFMDIVNEG
ncbi:BRCT domain-containing protein [Maridesulfovibrio hydrothermalis]|uniref:DNA ligase n=1 Tax=Maridesulfovibrio hydrothermalis AM13 = DSM 14728 TaxID=1121451 RepID=L0RCU8_9BACT|nr:BRCT domain-containing protein [Maridesulfovibrio hydrothermalis]CCO24608.1 DNA ligase [Maridesulfovibrio hydrothermalis AM13 = DSM 14728]